jgi:hypothetical protein
MISAVKETSPTLAYWMSHAEIEDAEIDASPGPTLSAALYSRLIPILSGQAIAILQGIPDQNGLEVWRTLSKRFNPITPFKCMMLFRKIVSMKLKKGEDMQTSVAKWEMHINNLERDHGEKMSDKIKMALMVQMLPDDIQRTIIQHMDRMENYRQVKDKLIGLVQSSATLKDDDAMDVDNLADERWDEYECETNALGKGSIKHANVRHQRGRAKKRRAKQKGHLRATRRREKERPTSARRAMERGTLKRLRQNGAPIPENEDINLIIVTRCALSYLRTAGATPSPWRRSMLKKMSTCMGSKSARSKLKPEMMKEHVYRPRQSSATTTRTCHALSTPQTS